MPVRPVIPASEDLLAAWRADAATGDAVAMQAWLDDTGALQACLQQQRVPTILDLHFGSGLAFLLTWQAWSAHLATAGAGAQGQGQHLHYVAILPHPCTVEQLAAQQARWPQLAPYAEALRAAWPLLLPGTHRIVLEQGQGTVVLTLILGAVDEELPRLDAAIDLFYLHGEPQRFDPTASAWTAQASKRLARLAWTGAHALAVAGDAAMATAWRQSGFVAHEQGLGLRLRYAPAWERPASHVATNTTPLWRAPSPQRHALVLGAGLAGSAVVERLSARGWQIDLVDAEPGPAQRASGNHGGLFMPALARDDSPLARLTRAAFLFASAHWQRLGGVGLDRSADTGVVGELCGILQFGRDAKQALSFEQGAAEWNYPAAYARWMSAGQSEVALGMASMGGGYFFPEAGWLNPPSVCRRALAVAQARGLLRTHYGRTVTALRQQDGLWQAFDVAGQLIASAPRVILAAGAQAATLLPGLPLNAVRGQVTHLRADDFPEIPMALCGDGYLTRGYDGQLCIGASYDRDHDTNLRADSHAENLTRLQHMLPQISANWTPPAADDPALQGRVGFRSIAPDRLPLVGAIPGQPGMLGALGYASRGLIWAPLMAELLAAMLEGEPLPLPRELVQALDPARFPIPVST